MFEIIDKDKKKIVISLHLEEIYKKMSLKTHLRNQDRLFSIDTLSKSCIDDLVQIKFEEKYRDYECFVDFTHIKIVTPNSKENLKTWIQKLPNAKIICDKKRKMPEGFELFEICEDNACGYREWFKEYAKKYIAEKCCDPKGYDTQIGVRLDVYIDLKKIINDSTEILRWCYIIAYDLDSYFLSVNESTDKRKLLFCHTMNGAYIAGILSQLLGCDLVYVDHLGPYNKLNKVDFYKGKSRAEEFIVVADLVCLGNEFLRAKNIVEYLGGNVTGCIGIMQMNISKILSEYQVNKFAIEYTAERAREELDYSVRTSLCNVPCDKCKREEKNDGGA